ncbi:MAG: ABC transporter ATP-binding protein [Flavobacteriaceae bacterium]
MIELTSIYKSFGELVVLNGIDLTIAPQELVAITGPSGAGKSTLLHIMGTLEAPDPHQAASIKLNGQSVLGMTPKALAEFRNQQLGFVFQSHELLPEFTAIENVCLPAWISAQPKAKTLKKAKELLSHLGLEHRFNHKPTTLSGGEKQRVAVARALINAPKIVMADEPSGNLDSQNAQELHQLFFDLRKTMETTFVIVTHNQEFAQQADRIIDLKDGQIRN